MSEKRNQRKVVDNRWEKKADTGRVVNEKHSAKEVQPPVKAKNDIQRDFLVAPRS